MIGMIVTGLAGIMLIMMGINVAERPVVAFMIVVMSVIVSMAGTMGRGVGLAMAMVVGVVMAQQHQGGCAGRRTPPRRPAPARQSAPR